MLQLEFSLMSLFPIYEHSCLLSVLRALGFYVCVGVHMYLEVYLYVQNTYSNPQILLQRALQYALRKTCIMSEQNANEMFTQSFQIMNFCDCE